MKNFILFLFLLTLTIYAPSCNKNSNQLPPVTLNTVTLFYPPNGAQLASIVLNETKNAYTSQTTVEVTNISNTDTLYGITLMVEICTELPQSFATCMAHKYNMSDTLPPGVSSKLITDFVNQPFTCDQAHVNAGLIQYSLNPHSLQTLHASRFSGLYSAGKISHFPNSNTSMQQSTYGYVLANGTTIFRINNDSLGTISGSFLYSDSTSFTGYGISNTGNMYPLQLIKNADQHYVDSVAPNLIWLWQIPNITSSQGPDGSDSIQITSSRQ